ncbi:hypothetical protein AB0L63_15485 [Nocardia sp. NPDC051990]|uniref:hypothetical protein n=1 Tax=Nocardia sp. NPDC051990 TaxID=3155285 RepID=UPI003424ECEF
MALSVPFLEKACEFAPVNLGGRGRGARQRLPGDRAHRRRLRRGLRIRLWIDKESKKDSITYEVTGSGTADISYSSGDFNTAKANDSPLPWTEP